MKKALLNWSIALGATLVTGGTCYFLANSFGADSFVFSWVLNFMLMAWYTLVVNLFAPKLDFNYFKAKKFERGGKIYEYLGIRFYRGLLERIGWEKLNNKAYPIRKDLAVLKARERNTRISELGHLVIAVIVFCTMLLVCDSLLEAKWLLVLNVLLNIYPIWLQRYTRPRYTRILAIVMRSKVR
ncbi:glycosyl-4,4'-diaponeurosporenoate acyltransferase CrtO family protein [Rufibacter hautae]|uniref:Glycosyl-4,4'-diaponeurosporenoate acyltransferase n=1 Tax=Rufibacter hautae TaxID=2595005 RepID=A0A5B6TC90_9BACT|nr:hypothetical protein [Rufibacter hautae]KAA3437788.1 hypothetical protein FOA19_10875 [Rufibacter hautae]